MSELRRDPVDGRWVIIAPDQRRRPVDFHTAPYPVAEGLCPFCPGHENLTPPEILARREAGSRANGPGWRVRVISNKFPVLRVEDELRREGQGYYDKMSGTGAHEVILESPRHEDRHATMSPAQLEEVFWVWRERMLDLRQDHRIQYVLVFKNYGTAAGANLQHPHSQLIALPILPKTLIEETEGAKEYFRHHERCIFCDIVDQEVEEESRLISANEDFIAIVPWAPIYPFEIWILPRRHQPRFEEPSEGLYSRFAQILVEVTGRLERALSRPHYNAVLHTSPFTDEDNDYYHWHLELMPRLTRRAGFEVGSGFYVNPIAPEDAAEFLRQTERGR